MFEKSDEMKRIERAAPDFSFHAYVEFLDEDYVALDGHFTADEIEQILKAMNGGNQNAELQDPS